MVVLAGFQPYVRRRRRIVQASAFLFGLAYFIRGLLDAQDQLLKRLPTDFSPLLPSPSSPEHHFPPPSHPLRLRSTTGIDGRYLFSRTLAHGQEGDTAIYTDVHSSTPVVVKTIRTAARNPLPPHLARVFADFTATWPTEVEAAFLLAPRPPAAIVPLVDYFILFDGDDWAWAHVTPLLSRGNLLSHARALSSADAPHDLQHPPSPDDADDDDPIAALDARHRPLLATLLAALAPLHAAGLCHDDVKPDNIFVPDDDDANDRDAAERWLLGDLGSVRHVAHPWHETRSWARQNQWRDCRLNDVRRALKSYLWFLRSVAAGRGEGGRFDREFWRGATGWSRLYWEWVRTPKGVEETVEWAGTVGVGDGMVEGEGGGGSRCEMMCGRSDEECAVQTETELICTTIPRRLWGWWWRWAPVW